MFLGNFARGTLHINALTTILSYYYPGRRGLREMVSSLSLVLLLLSVVSFQWPKAVSSLPASTWQSNGYHNSSEDQSPLRSRIGRTFKNLCTDSRKFCNCATTDTGLNAHEYAVLEVGGQPATWERLMEECIMEGYVNGDGLTYR